MYKAIQKLKISHVARVSDLARNSVLYSCSFESLIFQLFLSAYDLQLSDAMNDLQEQVKVEHAPTDKNEHGQEVSH